MSMHVAKINKRYRLENGLARLAARPASLQGRQGQINHFQTAYSPKTKDLAKEISPNHFILSVILFSVILLFSSCLEKEEGCLDPNAANVDVTADVNGNCIYPNMLFSVSHMWGSETYRENNVIPLANKDSIAITNFQLYVSDLVLGDVPQLTVYDSISLDDGNFIQDDLTILTLDALDFNCGHVSEFGTYDGLKFVIGYAEEWNQVDTASLADIESGHPWLDETMQDEEMARYVFKVDYNLINKDTVKRALRLVGPRIHLVTHVTQINTIQTNKVAVNLVIDYESLIQDIDLRSMDTNAIVESMWMNLEDAIEVSN